jgi:hypothetical protein
MEKKPRDAKYFKKFTERIIIGTGTSGLITGGYVLWPSVTQYFHEIPQALAKGELNLTSVIPLACCFGPAVLGFGLLYRAVRKIKGSPPYDR